MQSYKKLQQALGTFILRNQGKEYFPALPSLWLFLTFELTREPWFGIHNMWEECGKFFSSWVFFPFFEAFFLVSGHCTVCRDTTQTWQSRADAFGWC